MKEKGLASFAREYYEWIISVLVAILMYFVIHTIVEPIYHLNIEIRQHIAIELSTMFILVFILKRKESAQKSLKELNESTKLLHESIKEKFDAAMLSQTISNNYYNIISHPYNSLVNEYIKEVQDSQEKIGLVSLVESISESRKKLIIEQNEFWRILIERFVYSHFKSISSNKYILSLETYCNLLIDCIKLNQKIATDAKKTLVVISFTNATPADWFEEREVIGNPLRDYASQMKSAIDVMRNDLHIFRRFVVCKSDELNTQQNKEQHRGTMVGFSLFSEVKKDWVACGPEKKKIYLNDYHSDDNLAEVLTLKLPDLKFYHNCTEFVFVGFKDRLPLESDHSEEYLKDISVVDWKWCFSGGYTQNNVNISASFIDLTNISDSNKLIIDIPNKLNLIDKSTMIQRNKLEIAFKDFPNFILHNNSNFASIIQFNNLIPLAEKWEIASEIWHSNEEAEMMEKFFREQIQKDAKILDAACGTGQHSFIISSMKDMNYTLLSSDKDEDNLKIFKSKAADLGIIINCCKADWTKLVQDLGGEKFDVINCLGTSIPYYKSWKENGNGYEFTKEGLKQVLTEFKNSLNSKGKLIIGLSRHIAKNLTGTFLEFQPKRITNSKIGVPDGDYEMTWQFKYDWSAKRKRIWNCHIKNKIGDDYSFKLVSHLFDIEELELCCAEVFGEKNVEMKDIHSMSYDMFVICKTE